MRAKLGHGKWDGGPWHGMAWDHDKTQGSDEPLFMTYLLQEIGDMIRNARHYCRAFLPPQPDLVFSDN